MRRPFITIFNGRQRELGDEQETAWAQIYTDFRDYLYILKGARLAIFLAIALHANKFGWAWPSRKRLARETGYNEDTVSKALTDLCRIKIDGERLLMRYQTGRHLSAEGRLRLVQ